MLGHLQAPLQDSFQQIAWSQKPRLGHMHVRTYSVPKTDYWLFFLLPDMT